MSGSLPPARHLQGVRVLDLAALRSVFGPHELGLR